MEGMEVAQEIRRRGLPVRVLALSAYDDERYVRGMLEAGAVGYLLKEEAPGVIVAAVRGAVKGEGYFSPPPGQPATPALFIWDEERCAHLRAELDALCALTPEELGYILDTLSTSSLQLDDQLMDTVQPCPEIVGRQAETDPQVVIQAEVITRHDEHALLTNQTLHQIGRVHV